MDDQTTRRRSRSHLENDEEADAVRFGNDSSPDSSAGAKRIRLRGGRGASSEANEDEDEENENENENEDDGDPDTSNSFADETGNYSHTIGEELENGATDQEFKPGAIVRVKVENFVTYESAEFFPGPNLNMVIGPNGTGKSSLVCAICLGLGYHSNVLGRATSFGEFVKHGKDYATVEIELQKRVKDAKNYVIKLRINREDNSRKFQLNGKDLTHRKILEIMKKLRIQIDNLCQFLPQDRVAEFAALNPVDLLTKTLEAAADPEMIQWQKELKAHFVDQKAAQQQLNTDVETLTLLESRQQNQQHDIDRFREREQVQQAIADMKDARVMLVYDEARALFSKKKDEKRAAEAKHRELEVACGPSLEAVNQKEEYQRQVQAAVDYRRRMANDAQDVVVKVAADIEKLDSKAKAFQTEKESEVKANASKRKELGVSQQKITALKAKLKNNHKDFDAGEWNRKIRAQEHLFREKSERYQELEEQLARIRTDGSEMTQEKKKLDKEIENLDSQQGQALSQLRRFNPDVGKAWEWVQEHRDEFEKEVFGPPMLSCSINDQQYSNLIQAHMQESDFLCITAQTKNDHSKLTKQIQDVMGASVTVRTMTSPLSSFRSPMPKEALGQFGIDAYALDFLEGPEPVLAMLCSSARLHANGVALRGINDEQYDKIIQGEVINSWSAGDTLYKVARRREYGPGATSTTTRNINPGRFWTDQPVDMAERTELQRKLRECVGMIAELKGHFDQNQREMAEAKNEVEEIKTKISELKHNKNQLQTEYNQWKALPDKIEMETNNWNRKKAMLVEAKQRIAELDTKHDQIELDSAKLVLQHREQLSTIRTARHSLLEAQVRLIEAESDVTSLKDRNIGILQRLEEEKEKVRVIGEEVAKLRNEGQKLQAAATEVMGGDEDRKRHLIDLGHDKTVESISEDIVAEEAKLELLHGADDPSLLQDFESRAIQIERLQRQKASKEQQLEELNEKITDIRERWEPGVDDIIYRINTAFSYNFEQINCAGEVGVHKDEDFDKWAIEIKVKFRENETLQILNNQRQSGGERAVSTIFYLMSLQSMAQSPFRVVDEINQGMDPRNERMVHERMVEIACHEHTSQYFLITPKLLSNLKYDTRMKILCIASGEHMPEQGHKLDFARCVKVRRQLMAAAAG